MKKTIKTLTGMLACSMIIGLIGYFIVIGKMGDFPQEVFWKMYQKMTSLHVELVIDVDQDLDFLYKNSSIQGSLYPANWRHEEDDHAISRFGLRSFSFPRFTDASVKVISKNAILEVHSARYVNIKYHQYKDQSTKELRDNFGVRDITITFGNNKTVRIDPRIQDYEDAIMQNNALCKIFESNHFIRNSQEVDNNKIAQIDSFYQTLYSNVVIAKKEKIKRNVLSLKSWEQNSYIYTVELYQAQDYKNKITYHNKILISKK